MKANALLIAALTLTACAPTGTTAGATQAPVATQAPATADEGSRGLPTQAQSHRTVAVPSFRPETPLTTPDHKHFDKLLADAGTGLAVNQFDLTGGTDEKHNGHVTYHSTATVSVKGQADHAVTVDEDDAPVASNERNTITIADQVSGDKPVFSTDQAYQNYAVDRNGKQLTIALQADGSYLVDGQPAATTDAAAALVDKSPAMADVSLHTIATMYSLLVTTKRNPARELKALGCSACSRQLSLFGLAVTAVEIDPASEITRAFLALRTK